MSWAAASAEGDAVAVTMWHDLLDQAGPFVRYGFVGLTDPNGDWVHQYGNKERKPLLEHALTHLDGIIDPIVVTASTKRDGTQGKNVFWPVSIKMRIVPDSLLATGAFKAISVRPATLEDFLTETWPG